MGKTTKKFRARATRGRGKCRLNAQRVNERKQPSLRTPPLGPFTRIIGILRANRILLDYSFLLGVVLGSPVNRPKTYENHIVQFLLAFFRSRLNRQTHSILAIAPV